MFFCLAQHARGTKLPPASAVNESLQSLLQKTSHSSVFSLRIQSYKSFSAHAKNSESVSVFISIYLMASQTFVKKVVLELQRSQFSVLQKKEAYNDWFFMFNCRIGELNLVK